MSNWTTISVIVYSTINCLNNITKWIPDDSELGIMIDSISASISELSYLSSIINSIFFILGVGIIISAISDIRSKKTIHTFEVGSKKFEKYFTKWYSTAGTLSIICDDLDDWVTERITEELRKKSCEKRLQLFLGKASPRVLIDELEKIGATIKVAPQSIVSNYSFSCISTMGNNSKIIVRDKRNDDKRNIRFEELSSSYAIGLMNTLISELLSK